MNFKKENEERAEINLNDLLKVLWSERWRVAGAALATFIIGCIFIFLKQPVYETNALMQVKSAPNMSQASSLLSNMALVGGLGGGQAQSSQTQVEMTLMQSPYILKPTIRKLNLDVSIAPDYFPLIGSYLARHYTGGRLAPTRLGLNRFLWGGESWSLGYFIVPENAVKERFVLVVGENQTYSLFDSAHKLVLRGEVGAPSASDDGMVQLEWNTLNARPGAVFYLTKLSFTETLASLQKAFQLTELAPEKNGMPGPLNVDTGVVQLGLNSSHPGEAVQILNTILELTLSDNLQQKELSSSKMLGFIETQLSLAKANMIQSQTALNKEEQKTGLGDLKAQSAALLATSTQINAALAATETTRAQYQQIYTNQNPIMQSLNAQEASLEKQKAQVAQQIANLPLKEQGTIELLQTAQVQAKIYTDLLLNKQQSLLAKASTVSDLRVLDYAEAADEPLPLHGLTILLASLLLGAVLGSLYVLGRHHLKNGVTDPYWVEEEFGIRTVSVVPHSPAQAKAKKAYDQKASQSLPILALEMPEDSSLESVRSLRTSLFFALKEKKSPVITITGVTPQSGKSFISVNLAVILAQSGQRTLLIDADMRRGYLNRYFKKSHAPGLSDLLAGVLPLDKVISATGDAHLDFMASGIYPDNPSELLLNPHFKAALDMLSQHYDVILIDSPPILAVNDASIIAKEASLNYLVVPGGQLKSQEIDIAIRRFHNDGIVLSGTIFNFVKPGFEKMSKSNDHYRYTTHYKKDTDQQKAP